ncbi:hypothetical protein GCM10009122_36410 [Fulvivirga kasyanovii]|uniref:DUF3127 domain-containing protein n=1 Tax=Fulvivirga kasyanovii TaxID=396812 RepID=A0ABW9RYI4_9BACT|nr:hypothetical protein [Fulvivirga kasyanovii]MTI29131.1 hypothetical protein [Fulvivirga kasyanovii]
MNKLLILIALVLSSLAANGQELNCQDFRNGKFRLSSEYGDFIITRKAGKQIEYSEKFGTIMELRVDWINERTYRLQFVKILKNPQNMDFPDFSDLTVEIIKTTDNSYTQRSSSDDYELVLESELVRIE